MYLPISYDPLLKNSNYFPRNLPPPIYISVLITNSVLYKRTEFVSFLQLNSTFNTTQHTIHLSCICNFSYHLTVNTMHLYYKKAKESRNRTGVAQRVPGGLGSHISWHSAREGGEIVSLTHRPPLPPGMFLVLIFTMGWVDPRAMVRSGGNMSLKNPVITPGVDPGTVRLVAQRITTTLPQAPIFIIKTNILLMLREIFNLYSEIKVAARSEAWVSDGLLTEIVSSNPAEGVYVLLLRVLCVVR
jgi:hypothetical protein